MTPERQRIKIAEACGWTDIVFRGIKNPRVTDWIGRHPSNTPEGATGIWSGPLPDYLNDLNAMHEAEKTLRSAPHTYQPGGLGYYREALYQINDTPIFATAAQRAEAFLKTLNLWEE
jgi:hypothetical protein